MNQSSCLLASICGLSIGLLLSFLLIMIISHIFLLHCMPSNFLLFFRHWIYIKALQWIQIIPHTGGDFHFPIKPIEQGVYLKMSRGFIAALVRFSTLLVFLCSLNIALLSFWLEPAGFLSSQS